MKYKILLIALLLLLTATVQAQAQTENLKKRQEITIRNVTNEVVEYIIQAEGSKEGPMRRSIKVGEIDRYPGDKDMDCTFFRGAEEITYLLDAGHPYSFRYDENGELELYEGSHGRGDAVDLAPFVGTPPLVVERMLEMAQIQKGDVLYDLGCGDGRIVIMAARVYGIRGVGIDLDPRRIGESQLNARASRVEKLVEFRQADVTKVDFSEATVVTLYLLTESNELMRPFLEKHLKPGAKVVSHNYEIPGWSVKLIDEATMKGDDGDTHNIYVYRR
jgi:SAM-dependent methyltransferase